MATDGRAWREFCERLAAVGERILEDDFPDSPRDRAEGYRHLANQVVGWLGWSIGYRDPAHPAFFRQNDLVVKWGGPNVDQVTRRSRVDARYTYRITGEMGACEDFILTVKDGDMHEGATGILREVTAAELGLGPGDAIDIVLSATEHPGHWVELDARATMVNVREYYFDWQPRPPALLTIECLETRGIAPEPLTPVDLAAMLDEAASTVEHSITYWNEWVANLRRELGVNAVCPPRDTKAEGGSSKIAYGFGFPQLGEDEVLLVEADVPDAAYYDFQLYSLAWFESLDFTNRTTSLNHTQLTPGPDGRLQVVVAHRDPGVPNWLDTEGHRDRMITYRWIKPVTQPVATSRVVPFADLRDALPAGTRTVTPEQRRDELAARQRHGAWRYRT
jgi:hypothetical protein